MCAEDRRRWNVDCLTHQGTVSKREREREGNKGRQFLVTKKRKGKTKKRLFVRFKVRRGGWGASQNMCRYTLLRT